jgi:hypothetical protein
MAKFKQITVKPLTSFDSLNLKVASEKRYDMSQLPQEAQTDLMKKLMEIARKSGAAIVTKPVHGQPAVSAVVKSTKKKGLVFAFPEPNPIHLYYRIAVEHLEKAGSSLQKFYEAQHSHPQNEYKRFCEFFEEAVQGIVFLLMTVEGFLNQLPAEGQTYNINGSEKSKKDLEWMDLTEKLRHAVPALTGVDLHAAHRLLYDRLQLLNDLRNDLIHLKTLQKENYTYYQELFKRLLDFGALEVANAVFDFINLVKSDYFEEEQVTVSNPPTEQKK